MFDSEALMQLAIDKAREGVVAGQSPFGCAIAKDDQLLAVCHNTVLSTTDITAHAEINALRAACTQIGNILLNGCVVATTCEPCPMCMAALHWARVSTVYFGASIADAEAAGFNELQVPAADVLSIGGSNVQLNGGVLADECKALFDQWLKSPNPQTY
jgi:tRNA(Arg) A34 adenosine deaminase TadA